MLCMFILRYQCITLLPYVSRFVTIATMPRTAFTDAQKAQCVIWTSEGYRPTAIQRLFRTKYECNAPSRKSILKWVEDYRSRGSHSHRGGNGRPGISEEKRSQIKEMFQTNPRRSLRDVAREVSLPHTTVWNVIRKQLNMFPYRLQIAQQLSHDDKTNRLNFAQFLQAELVEDSHYLERIVFSDECSFSLGGAVNKQNCRIWGSERPDTVYESPQSTQSIMVWCALSKNEVIGPYFFENGNVTGDSYKRMLRYYLFPKLRNYPENMIFQQDGAPPHFALPVRAYLDVKVPNRWMGRAGPIPWPARSPDLTPCDYFLWGYLKDQVFDDLPNTIPQLKTKISQAIATITPATLQKVYKNLENRLAFVIRQDGGHFEQLQN